MRAITEVPVQEDMLMRILIIGLGHEVRVNPSDCMDIAETVVRRAAQLRLDGQCSYIYTRQAHFYGITCMSVCASIT